MPPTTIVNIDVDAPGLTRGIMPEPINCYIDLDVHQHGEFNHEIRHLNVLVWITDFTVRNLRIRESPGVSAGSIIVYTISFIPGLVLHHWLSRR